jgi:hypothetical protein
MKLEIIWSNSHSDRALPNPVVYLADDARPPLSARVPNPPTEARESASSGRKERSVYIPVGFEENLSLLTTSVFYISDLLHKLETRYNTTDFTS